MTPDEPVIVVVAGCGPATRSSVVGCLLGRAAPLPHGHPSGGYVRVTFAPDAGRRPHPRQTGRVPDCPPRRFDVAVAHPLLRHLTLVEAPAIDRLSGAGLRILADAAGRGGAVVHVQCAGSRLTAGEVAALKAYAAAGATVFMVVIPDSAGRWKRPPGRGRHPRRPDGDDPRTTALEAHRGRAVTAVPTLADADWFTVDPPAADGAYLRRALVEWADEESLRRTADALTEPPGGRPVAVPRAAVASGWRSRSEQVQHRTAYALRHHLAAELAGIHLRAVRHMADGVETGRLLRFLDDELHALSLHADAETERGLQHLLGEVLGAVLGRRPTVPVRESFAAAVRSRLPADDLARALLVTADADVVAVLGRAAVADLRACRQPDGASVLPGIGLALAGECWAAGSPGLAGEDRRRRWIMQVAGALDRALSAELSRRLHGVRSAVHQVVDEAVAAGILPT